ncbi:MAG: 50S ribosomal protein L11 methyltransferase [Pseudomonadales bacterium]
MSWLKLALAASAEQLDATEAALESLGAQAITVLPLDDAIPWEPAPGELPTAPRNRVEALFALGDDFEGMSVQLQQALAAEQLQTLEASFLAEEDWQARALSRAVSAQFGGKLWLLPKSAPAQSGPTVRLDPGMAFGTGSHPTTRLCLTALAEAAPLSGPMLDYGCGSGVLAIAALQLGSASGVAVDYDPQALLATSDNATYNGVRCDTAGPSDPTAATATQDQESGALHICLPEQFDDTQRFDLVVANILANPLIELAPRLQRVLRPGGRLILAGLLTDQADSVRAAYEHIEFASTPALIDDQWQCLNGVRL